MSSRASWEERVTSWSRWCDSVARGAVVGMVLLVCGNIVMRIFGRPIFGSYEIVSFLGVIIVALALPYCALNRGHIAVEIVHDKLPPRLQMIIDIFTKTLSLGFFVLVCWQSAVYATKLMLAGEITMTLKWSFYPFIYVISFSCLILCFVLLIDLIKAIRRAALK